MNEQSKFKDIDSLFEGFNIAGCGDDNPTEYKTLSLWFPAEYKIKYDLLQKRSKNKFGKLLKEVIKRSIDKVNVEDEAC